MEEYRQESFNIDADNIAPSCNDLVGNMDEIIFDIEQNDQMFSYQNTMQN